MGQLDQEYSQLRYRSAVSILGKLASRYRDTRPHNLLFSLSREVEFTTHD